MENMFQVLKTNFHLNFFGIQFVPVLRTMYSNHYHKPPNPDIVFRCPSIVHIAF